MKVRKRAAIGAHARIGWVNSLGSTNQAVGIASVSFHELSH